MKRILLSAVAILAPCASVYAADPALGAMRPAYDTNWESQEANPLRFETGLRYWYAVGEQSIENNGVKNSAKDYSHILEGHFRIDDDFTSTFVKGQAGYAFYTSGDYEPAVGGNTTFEGGQIGYVGSDFGWTPFGNEQFRFGALVGYQYNRESPDRNRLDVEHIDGLSLHSLRLGVTASANVNEFFDIDAEVVATPYAFAYGATAEIPSATQVVQGVPVNRTNAEATAALYGASGQVMLGFHPTENLTLRFGGRASILTGQSSVRVKQWNSATPNSYLYSDTAAGDLTLVRYGALAEVTGRF